MFEITVLDCPDAVNAVGMSSALEFFFKEGIYHAESNAETDNTLTERQDIGIVVLSAHLGHKLIAAKSASDALILIADKGNADSGSADGNASFGPAALYVLSDLDAGINIRK